LFRPRGQREAEWAAYSDHPLIICLKDGIPANLPHADLANSRSSRGLPFAVIDFSAGVAAAERELRRPFETEAFKPSYSFNLDFDAPAPPETDNPALKRWRDKAFGTRMAGLDFALIDPLSTRK
jgi:hypothetical protein